jgi:hypothetical protein
LVRSIQRSAAEKAKARQEQDGDKRRSRIWYIVLVVVALANAYVWTDRPEWLVGNVSQLDTAAEREGVLRFRMYVQGQRIEAYRRETGVLPDGLDLTGAPFEGMRYQRTGPASWELMGELEDVRLLLRSSQSMSDFLAETEVSSDANRQ